MQSMLKVKNVSVHFNNKAVIQGLSFELNKGDVMAIVGPNGAGKSVLFRALLGLVPYEGEIQWPENVKIGYVPQKLAVERDLPLNVMEFLQFKGASVNEIHESLHSVGLDHCVLGKTRLGQLSGGELQRVLIAYALMNHPDVLLFDEPTAGVDIGGEETIYSLIEKLHAKTGLTILLITHDLNIIYRYAGKVLCLNKSKICYGSPREALDAKVLEELYGAKVNIYPHEHQH